MARTVFFGFGAYVGTITGPTTCAWWPDDPNVLKWASGAMVPVDLSLNPQAVRDGKITADQIQVDDFAGWGGGGLTKIGPIFPLGSVIGACWLSSTYYASLGNAPARVGGGSLCFDYELTSVLDWASGRRFYGVHAQVQSVAAPGSTVAQVAIWSPGTSQVPNQPPFGVFWLDLAAAADPVANGLSTLDATSTKSSTGALFIDMPTARSLIIYGPKKPPATGQELLVEIAA